MKKLIGVIDYKLGNTQSVRNAISRLNYKHKLCQHPDEMRDCTHIILPGVGSYNSTMENLKSLGFIDVLKKDVFNKEKLFLGICVGFQILFEEGVENMKTSGIGLFKGFCDSFSKIDKNLLSPHCGWNEVLNFNDMKLFKGINNMDSHFYFLHSFFVNEVKKNKIDIKASNTIYEKINFVSAIEFNNVFGCQFHPEKSLKNGEIYLKNFCEI
jgi:glutamine amidotransferase